MLGEASRVLVLGAGVSGMAAARLASAQGMSVTVYAETAPAESRGEFGMATGEWDPVLLEGFDLVVASPGFSERSGPVIDVMERGLPIWSEIEFAYRHIESPVVAITGTNGKTTVTEATAAMLDASGLDAPATGNIGAPLADFTDGVYDALVVEVSSFQLRFTESFHPVAAAITNVAVDHLDWHGSAYAYQSAKARIFANQTSDDLLVYDVDDEGAAKLAGDAPSELYPVSGIRMPEGGGGVDGRSLRVGDVAIDVSDLVSDDPIHLVNLACAAALALRVGATADGVARGAISYRPGAHRRTVVGEAEDVMWVDDSKATNPHAALASIRAHGPVILIAGGRAKGVDLAPLAGEDNVRMLIGIGEAGAGLVAAAGDRGRLAGTLEIAVEMAAGAARPGDTVLLAPGCASFDQFDSYVARGDRFAELVRERLGGPSQ
ncbi:MAG TPA: UDP-N-acetylmuramoyl-L-alanine--D-glutamate ligase [Acidimicrobiia bacterium]|nr:UDP-N-acetylmuramoyl-L-alanine--D-glutamate ligase [Acidimicrobiia bacterium]